MEELIVQQHLQMSEPLTSPPVPHLLAEKFLYSCILVPLPLLVHSVHPSHPQTKFGMGREYQIYLFFISLRSLNQFEMTVSFAPIARAIDKFFAVFNVISG